MAKPLAIIDNSKLREQARQQRQELARLQLAKLEKQPTKNLFGPPIPVSRPNDPTFEQLSNFFGSPVGADISCFRSSSNNDSTAPDEGRGQRLTGAARHGDPCRAEPGDPHRAERRQNDSRHSSARQTDVRRGDAKHGDAKHGDARHGDARHGDARHGDARRKDSRPNDNRNKPAVKNSQPGHCVTAPLGLNGDQSRQGILEQPLRSSSKNPFKTDVDKVPKTLASRQSTTEAKTKLKSHSLKDSKLDGPFLTKHSNGSTNSKSEHHPKQPTTNRSKHSSSPAPDSSETSSSSSSSSFPSNKTKDVRNEAKNSPTTRHRTDFRKELSSARVNGACPGASLNGKNSPMEKKLMLSIPKEFEKCDDFVTKVLQEVSIRSPLTGILTPKKADLPFPFPDPASCLLGDYITNHHEAIPECLLSADEDDDNDEVTIDKVEPRLVQRPEHLFDSTGKTIPNQSPNVLDDLDVSDSSDSENEQVEIIHVEERTRDGNGQKSVTDHKSSGSVPLLEDSRSQRLLESSEVSSSEESCTSESESDSSRSENEDDKETRKITVEKDGNDKTESKQCKRTSWEMKNFIPKSNEHVPFNSLLSSSPSSPCVNMIRQMSNDDFDIDINDPIKEIYMMSPLPVPTSSDAEHAESSHSVDFSRLLSPKILPCPSITVNGERPVAPPPTDSLRVDSAGSEQEPTSCARSPLHRAPFLSPVSGVHYCAGKPSVVVRIQCSYLLRKAAKSAECKDTADDSTCRITDGTRVSAASSVSSKSAVQTDYRSPVYDVCEPDLADYSPGSAVTKFKKSSDPSLSKSSSCHSESSAARVLPSATPKQEPVAPSSFDPVSDDRKELTVENSPPKIGRDKTADDAYLLTSKVTKRKSSDVNHFDQKKICDRSSVARKEDRKEDRREDRKDLSRLQNGNPDRSHEDPLVEPDIKNELKSPVTNGEENSRSSSSSSSQTQKRTEKTKAQNGHARSDEKTRKTPVPKVNGKITNSEALLSVSNDGAKISTPVVNGIGENPPPHRDPDICDGGSSCDLNDNMKQTAEHDHIDHLPIDPKNPLNGIKRFKCEPEKLESSDVYMQNARKLKHEGDSRPDKFFKVLSYTESVLAFVCHCSALEAEHAELARIQKMLQDTLALCQYIVRVMEGVASSEKYHLIVINLRLQAIISLRLYNTRKADVAKLKSVLDEHNKSHVAKPLQIPSPYQTNHLHSANNTAVGWNHADGTPSPRSPRPSPSPAGSIGSVGSAGSSNGDAGMAKPMSFANGHGLASIAVPQRIHSVMMNFLNYMNCLHQCHDFWDQAGAVLAVHPIVGDFFHSIDSEFGPIDLHSSTSAIIRYASEVVRHVRKEVKRLSQVVRTD